MKALITTGGAKRTYTTLDGAYCFVYEPEYNPTLSYEEWCEMMERVHQEWLEDKHRDPFAD